jgi:hypothetical protein
MRSLAQEGRPPVKRINLRMKGRCKKCRRLIPFTNPKAGCAAMRRHRDKYHKDFHGKLSYKILYPCPKVDCKEMFEDDGAALDHAIEKHWPQQPAPRRRKK